MFKAQWESFLGWVIFILLTPFLSTYMLYMNIQKLAAGNTLPYSYNKQLEIFYVHFYIDMKTRRLIKQMRVLPVKYATFLRANR